MTQCHIETLTRTRGAGGGGGGGGGGGIDMTGVACII